MSDALSIAADLGFSVAPPPSQEDLQNLSTGGEKGDDLIRVLRELTSVQRKIADLQVELQGRKEDKNVVHLTHVSEMEKKIETLERITTILMKAASDYGSLTSSVADFQWTQNFKEPPSVWGEMLRPIPVALASCTRFFEAMTAMRESFATLQKLRIGPGMTKMPLGDNERTVSMDSNFMTPPPWEKESSFDDSGIERSKRGEEEEEESNRRLSWPLGKATGL